MPEANFGRFQSIKVRDWGFSAELPALVSSTVDALVLTSLNIGDWGSFHALLSCVAFAGTRHVLHELSAEFSGASCIALRRQSSSRQGHVV
jgi:hypothetical protein